MVVLGYVESSVLFFLPSKTIQDDPSAGYYPFQRPIVFPLLLVYLHAGPLKKPLPVFRCYRC